MLINKSSHDWKIIKLDTLKQGLNTSFLKLFYEKLLDILTLSITLDVEYAQKF